MGLLGSINLDIGGVLSGIGTLAKDIRSAITGEMSPEKKAEIESKLIEIQAAAQKAQTDINAVEAAHPSIFVSGWRPAVGWVCAAALGYNYVCMPFLHWTVRSFYPEVPALPVLDMGELMTLLFALLGLGGYRSYEKAKGVARD